MWNCLKNYFYKLIHSVSLGFGFIDSLHYFHINYDQIQYICILVKATLGERKPYILLFSHFFNLTFLLGYH